MKEKFRISSILPFIYVLFACLPCLYLLFPPVAVNKPSDIGTLIILAITQALFSINGISSGLVFPFEEFKEVNFKVRSLANNPGADKSSALSRYALTAIIYFVPLLLSIAAINIFMIKENIGPGLLIAVGCFAYNLCVLGALIVRISKFYDYMEKTAQEDFEWEVAKSDVTKLIRSLTVDNHTLELSPGAYKDTTFIEFKDVIVTRIKRLQSYQELNDEKKLILLREAVLAASIFEVQVCTAKYIEL